MVANARGILAGLVLPAVLGASAIAAGAVLWQHYSGLVDAKADLTAKAAALEVALAEEKSRGKALEKAISQWDQASTAQAEALKALAAARSHFGAQSREIRNVLSTHDLEALARAKPGLVEARVNTGTVRALRLLEHASAAASGNPTATASTSASSVTPASAAQP
jgi:hypothetical protein